MTMNVPNHLLTEWTADSDFEVGGGDPVIIVRQLLDDEVAGVLRVPLPLPAANQS